VRVDPPEPELILAPIRGITDCVYRTALARWFPGFDRAFSPFIQVRRGHPLRPGDLRQLAPENNRAMPVIPQLLTNHADSFVQVLGELQDFGYDDANWNLGCPSPTVAKRGRGAGLLPHPERIDAILDNVLARSTVRLSVKLRLGRHDPNELVPVLEILNRYPLSEIILHPRTADQLYEGDVDIGRAQEALSVCRHPFMLSGGISSVEEFVAFRSLLPGVSAWMIGRGALSSPALPGRIKGAPPHDATTSREVLHGFHDALFTGYREWLSGPGHLLAKMKEHWTYLSVCFARPKEVVARIGRSRDVKAFAESVAWTFEQPSVF